MEDPDVDLEPGRFQGQTEEFSEAGGAVCRRRRLSASKTFEGARQTYGRDDCYARDHIPSKAWCPYCVRGRGKSFQQRRVDHSQDDKGHSADGVGGQKMRVFVARDRFTNPLFLYLAPAEGVELFYPEAALLRDVQFLGYTQLTLKSDQEPSSLTPGNVVRNALFSQNIECQLESSPNVEYGEAESRVGLPQGLFRTLKAHVEHKIGQGLDPKSPLLN